MKVKNLKPVYGYAKAICPKCGEAFEYPIAEKEMIFDRFQRFKSNEFGWVYKRYHRCKSQSSLETFIKSKNTNNSKGA
jgi:hypothetical protein